MLILEKMWRERRGERIRVSLDVQCRCCLGTPFFGKDISREKAGERERQGENVIFNASLDNQLFVMEFYLSWSLRDEKRE